MSLITDLLHFREEASRREGTENFKIFSKATLDAIAFSQPKNKAELTAIKGIKEAKYRKYGQAILALVAAHSVGRKAAFEEGYENNENSENDESSENFEAAESNEPLSVNAFLEAINTELSGFAARVQGEISDMSIWQNRLVFFSLKDSAVDSIVKCSISYQNYLLCGGALKIGDQVIVEGYPKIYKPRGELSFQVLTLELCGEGVLKKAYDELFTKLEVAGAFDQTKKRPLPKYPTRIALITSKDGAALGDFQMNIGRFGLKVDLYPSGVEGARAIHELIAAVRYFKKRADQYDLLVIVRGGGGLESLQAFNNEVLVNEIMAMPIPTLCGIGHEKDITLASLVADQMESTPTACALVVTSYWEQAREGLRALQQRLPRLLEGVIFTHKNNLSEKHQYLFRTLISLKDSITRTEQSFLFWLTDCQNQVKKNREQVAAFMPMVTRVYQGMLTETKHSLTRFTEILAQLDPARVLALGYSIIRKAGSIITSTKGVVMGDILQVHLDKGSLTVTVKKID